MVDIADPEPPEILAAERSDLAAALKAGWQDLARAPLYGLAFSLVYVLGGWAMLATFAVGGQVWWMIPASAGLSDPWALHRLRVL